MGNQISMLRPVAFLRQLFSRQDQVSGGNAGDGGAKGEMANGIEEIVDINSIEITYNTSSTKLDLTSQHVLNEELFYKALHVHDNPIVLQELTLNSKRKLTAIPVTIGHFDNLVSLNLSNNGLTDLPWSVLYLCKLEKLHLSRNSFQHIPRIIAYLTELVLLLT